MEHRAAHSLASGGRLGLQAKRLLGVPPDSPPQVDVLWTGCPGQTRPDWLLLPRADKSALLDLEVSDRALATTEANTQALSCTA